MLVLKKNRQGGRGFTLTEAAIVLGIVGLILGAIWSAAGAVYRSQRVSHTSDQLIQMVQAIRSLYSTSAVVDTNLSVANLITAGAVPKDMVNGTAAVDLWGGSVTIVAGNCLSTNDCFVITLNSVPKEACTDLLTRTAGTGRDSGLIFAGKNGAETNLLDSTNVLNLSTAATTHCTALTNNISYKFMLKG